MHDQPRRELQTLVRHYGPGLITDPQRTEALLSDICGEHQREIFVLTHAQRSHIPTELSRMIGQRAEGVVRRRLAQQLQERYAFSDEAATWAVDVWADALNIRAMPLYQSWLLRLWHILRNRIVAFFYLWQGEQRRPAGLLTHRTSSEPSISGRIGVQWRKLPARLLLILILAAVAGGTGWMAVQDSWLAGLQSFTFERGEALTDNADQSFLPRGATTALFVQYPPPLEARIEADLLNVRSAPTLGAEILGKVGPLGVNVTVDDFTDDGEWSHIALPVDGWISNEFVTFPGEKPEQRVYLQPVHGQVARDGAQIHSTPHADAPATATLEAGQTLVLVARSTDGQWRQVVEPSPGWVESRLIRLMER